MRTFLTAVVLALATGCCATGARESAYHDGVKQYAVESGLLDEYEKYIDADPVLKPQTKVIRKGTVKGFRALITEEEKSLKKD